MTPDEILAELSTYTGTFPEDAVRAAIEILPELTPRLLTALEEVQLDPDLAKVEESMLHIYAMHLLGQVREPRAFPLLLRMARLPEAQVDAILGDSITEGLPQALASTCNGDWEALKSLVEDPRAYEFCRSSGLVAILSLVAEGALERTPVLEYCNYLLSEGLEREYSYIWDATINAALDLGVGPCEKAIRKALEEGLVDAWGPSVKELERELKRKEPLSLKTNGRESYRYLGDSVDEMSGWACFNTKKHHLYAKEPPEDLLETVHPEFQAREYRPITSPSPIRREGPKIGRNDPCPCESGKKYKKCCGK